MAPADPPVPQQIKRECYYRKYFGEQCQEAAVYESCGLNNIVDGWTWCINHPPAKEFRRTLTEVRP